MDINLFNKYKPMLSPNNKADGKDIDWHTRLTTPTKVIWNMYVQDWYASEKLDGIRVALMFKNGKCTIKTRSLKNFRSILVKRWEEILTTVNMPFDIILDGEIYCPEMQFSELQHFILSEDVSSIQSIKKTVREQANGKFYGRNLDWLTNYERHNITINLFDSCMAENKEWQYRNYNLYNAYTYLQHLDFVALVTQRVFEEVDGILNWYNNVVEDGGEGLILKHSKNEYKFGRVTLNQNTLFKMKDEANWYEGVITDVLEGTEVDPWVERTVTELGYSRTSKLKDDRSPSGMAKGFEVLFDGDKKLVVTLKGFDNNAKEQLLDDKNKWLGRRIEFLGMPPTKTNGVPRQAKYINKF